MKTEFIGLLVEKYKDFGKKIKILLNINKLNVYNNKK
jgi:hypothetical protein